MAKRPMRRKIYRRATDDDGGRYEEKWQEAVFYFYPRKAA